MLFYFNTLFLIRGIHCIHWEEKSSNIFPSVWICRTTCRSPYVHNEWKVLERRVQRTQHRTPTDASRRFCCYVWQYGGWRLLPRCQNYYRFLRSFKSAKVDADVLEMEAALAFSTHMKIDYPGCHLHQNVNIRNYSDKGQVAQQLDGVLHGHLSAPTFAMVLEAKTSIHPDHLAEILEKVTLFRGFVS